MKKIKHQIKRTIIKLGLFPLVSFLREFYFSNYIVQWMKRRKIDQGFWKEFIKEGDLCFDIGANVGKVTDCLLNLGAKVVLVEPQPQCIKILKRKYKGNPRVKAVIGKGVGAKKEKREFNICEEADGLSTFVDTERIKRFPGYQWNKKIEVSLTTLDDLIEEFEKGNIKEAIKLQHKIFPLCKAMFIETNPIPVKTALALMGKITGELRLPLCSMSEENLNFLRKTLADYGLI